MSRRNDRGGNDPSGQLSRKEVRKAQKAAASAKREADRSAGKGSLQRRLKAQEKELSTLNAEQRRRRASAKDVYSAIGYNAMYRDGICEVEEGLFSQTVSFSDISYQSAREENQ